MAISSLPKTRPSVRGFQTPGVPVIPSLGILINIYLMFRLSPLTLVRFAVWMLLGENTGMGRPIALGSDDNARL